MFDFTAFIIYLIKPVCLFCCLFQESIKQRKACYFNTSVTCFNMTFISNFSSHVTDLCCLHVCTSFYLTFSGQTGMPTCPSPACTHTPNPIPIHAHIHAHPIPFHPIPLFTHTIAIQLLACICGWVHVSCCDLEGTPVDQQ